MRVAGSLKASAVVGVVASMLSLQLQGFAQQTTPATSATPNPTKVKPGINLFSVNDDIKFGRSAANQVERQMQMINDPVIQAWVNQLGRRLAASTTMPQLPWKFRVVNSRQVNAFALPGGFVYVNRGLIEMTNNECEVAGAMGHEMAHVTLRHGTNQMTKAILIQGPIMMTGAGGGLGEMGGGLMFLKFSRNAERDADIVGTQTMVKAGYDPKGMVDIFEKLQRIGAGRGTPEFLSDHPSPENRTQRIQQEISKLQVPRDPERTSELFDDAKRILRDMPPAPSTSPQTTTANRRGGPYGNDPNGPYGRGQDPNGGYGRGQDPNGPYGRGSDPNDPNGQSDDGYGRGNGNGGGNGRSRRGSSSDPSGDSDDSYNPPYYGRSGRGGSSDPNSNGDNSSGRSGGRSGRSSDPYDQPDDGSGPVTAGNRTGNGSSGRGSANPRRGTNSPELPSETMSSYESADGRMAVDYPSNWQVQNQGQGGSSMTFGPEWAFKGATVTHGVTIGTLAGGRSGQANLDDAITRIVSTVNRSNPNMKESGGRFDQELSGQPARGVYLMGRNSQGEAERQWIVVTATGAQITYMVFVAPDREFQDYEPAFQTMFQSLQVGAPPDNRN